LNWRKWNAGKRQRSDKARHAANTRWDRVRAARAGEPVRETRVVELTIRDSHRPMRIVRLQAEELERSWSRWAVSENGQKIGNRRFGRNGIADLLARSLE
jgi:hypothetical protein